MNVLDAVAERGVVMRLASARNHSKGPEYHGPCPACGDSGKGDKSNKFHVWPEQNDGKGFYWCRSCGKRGDLVQFFRDFAGMGFKEACKAAGRELPERRGFAQDAGMRRAGNGAAQPAAVAAPCDGVDRAAWAAAADKFVSRCREAIQARPDVLKYLAGRGIGADVAERYAIGWHGGEGGRDCAFRPRASWGLPPETDADGAEKRLWIPRGIVIPYAVNGQVVRVKIRRPKEDRRPDFDLPYHFMPGGSREMMVTRTDRKAYVVVEAELDAVAVDAAAGDLVGAVAIGTNRAKPGAGLHGRLEAAHKILVALDFDGAGASAWPWWEETYHRAVRWPVPAGKDPGDAVAAGVDLRAWIMAGLPPSVTGLAMRRAGFGSARPEVTAQALEGRPARGEKTKPAAEAPPVPRAAGAARGTALPEVPESLTRMYGYLRRYPVQVYTGGGHMRIVHAENWRGWAELREISGLVFGDEDLGLYLQCHPAETIHRGNFWDGIGGVQ